MCCLFDFFCLFVFVFVPGVNQSRRQTAPQAAVEPPPGCQHLDPQTLRRTMGPTQWRSLGLTSREHDCPLSRNHPSWSFKDTRIPQTPPAEITQILANPAALRRNPRA